MSIIREILIIVHIKRNMICVITNGIMSDRPTYLEIMGRQGLGIAQPVLNFNYGKKNGAQGQT